MKDQRLTSIYEVFSHLKTRFDDLNMIERNKVLLIQSSIPIIKQIDDNRMEVISKLHAKVIDYSTDILTSEQSKLEPLFLDMSRLHFKLERLTRNLKSELTIMAQSIKDLENGVYASKILKELKVEDLTILIQIECQIDFDLI